MCIRKLNWKRQHFSDLDHLYSDTGLNERHSEATFLGKQLKDRFKANDNDRKEFY